MENENGQQETFPLSEEIIQLLGEVNTEIQRLNAQAQGAVILFLRQHKLQGDWRVAPNNRELVKNPATARIQ